MEIWETFSSDSRSPKKHLDSWLFRGTGLRYWPLTFLHYPSPWLGRDGKAEQTAGCHAVDTASPFATTGKRHEADERGLLVRRMFWNCCKMSKLSDDISIEIKSSDWLTMKRTQMAQQIKDVCRYERAQGQITECWTTNSRNKDVSDGTWGSAEGFCWQEKVWEFKQKRAALRHEQLHELNTLWDERLAVDIWNTFKSCGAAKHTDNVKMDSNRPVLSHDSKDESS